MDAWIRNISFSFNPEEAPQRRELYMMDNWTSTAAISFQVKVAYLSRGYIYSWLTRPSDKTNDKIK